MSENAEAAAESLKESLGEGVLSLSEFRGETTVVVDSKAARDALVHCRESLGFNYLIDISSVDHMGQDPRWEVVYELYTMRAENGVHLRIKYALEEDEKGPTVSDLWPTADWHEREIYDMMGIEFADHPDLRRILMWEGYPFFPLRKDFPLAGRPSEMPDVAFTDRAPLAGGPFVTSPTTESTVHREPRSREMD